LSSWRTSQRRGQSTRKREEEEEKKRKLDFGYGAIYVKSREKDKMFSREARMTGPTEIH
jgi:hypothetical protein